MGLSFKPLGRVVKGLGASANPFDNGNSFDRVMNNRPTNIQRAQQSIRNANQQIATQPNRFGVLANPQNRQMFVRNNVVPSTPNLGQSIQQGLADAVTRPDLWASAPKVNVGAFKGSGVIEDFLNSPFKIGGGAVKVGQGQIKQGVGDVITGALEGPLGFIPVGKTAQVGLKGTKFLPALGQSIKAGAKYGGGFGAVYGGADAASQNGSALDIAKGAALSGAVGAVGGAALGTAVPVVGAGVRVGAKVTKAKAPVVAKAVKSHTPSEIQKTNESALLKQRAQLDKQWEQANSINTRKSIEKAIKQNMQEIQTNRQGGYAKIPGKGDAPQVGKTDTITAYHGSTNNKLTSLEPGAKNGLNEKRNLVYLTEDRKTAGDYAKARGDGGLGVLKDSPTGRVYDVQVNGKVLDAYDRTGLDKLKTAPGYEQLSGKTKNQLTNDTGLSPDILEANPELVNFLKQNDITAVRTHLPNGGGATQLAVLNPKNTKVAPQVGKTEVSLKTTSLPPPKSPTKVSTPVKPVVKTVEQRKVPAKKETPESKQLTLEQIDANLENLTFGRSGNATFEPTTLGKLGEKLSPNRQIRKATQAVEGGVNSFLRGSLESGSRVARVPGRAAVGITRQAARTPDEISRLAQYRGEKEVGDVFAKATTKAGNEAVKGGVSRQAVHQLLDPELSARKGGSFTPDELAKATPEAQKLKDINSQIHEGYYKMGFLDDETYKKHKGSYIRRDATDFFKDDKQHHVLSRDNKLDLDNFQKRKDLPDIPDDVVRAMNDDPYYLTALNQQSYQRNKAYYEYSNWLAENGSVSSGPKKGYVEVPDSPAYGSLKGKYVLKEQLEDLQGFIYETDAASHAMALLNWYDRNPVRKARKSILTIYNPGVRLGNRTFNYLTTTLNGINPVTFTKNWYKGKALMKANSPEYIEATRAGIFGSSIIDKELYRTTDLKPSANIAKKTHGKIADTYSGVDDLAKFSAYLTYRQRGLNTTEAARRVHRMLQNYDMVGHFFDIGAKTPIAGNAFIRFSSELMRMVHNTALDNPLRLAGAAVAASTLITMASKLSGETPEDRKTREERVGAPRVPFTNQSLEVQTPWGAVNTGRLLGITTYNDLVGGINEDVKRLTPFQLPFSHDKTGFHANVPGLTADPLIGPLMGLALDKDFRGKPITDPDKLKYPSQPLSSGEQLSNRLNYLKQSYVPYANEFDSLKSAIQGEPNYYGKERTPAQAGLRIAGIKVENFGKKQAAEQRSKNEYFSGENERAQDFLRTNPDLVESYNKFKGREKDRKTGKKYVDLVTPEKWKILSSDTSGRLYDYLKSEALISNQKDDKPIDPVFQLPTPEQTKQVIDLRSRPTGDDIETEEILRATQPWYSRFEKAEQDYYNATDGYYSKLKLPDTQGDRAKAYAAIVYPEQSPLIKRYYAVKANQGNDTGKAFYKANADTLSADFKKYRAERLKYINDKRKIEGYPPISEDSFNNVTFGYEDDERKVYNQLKYGFGSGYGSKSDSSLNSYKYSVNSVGAKVKAKAPVRVAGIKKIALSSKASKPKVTSKKSLV